MITAKTFTTLFLILLPLKLLIQLYLGHRNQKHILAHQGSVPNPFIDKITLDEHQKAAHYTRAKSKFVFYNLIFDAAILFVWIQGGVLNNVDLWISHFSENEIIKGLALFATIGLVGLIINLPWQVYSTFVLEEKFGFNKTTPKLFVMDMIKQLILSTVIAIPLLWGILAMMKGLGDYWWIWGWGFLTAFQFLLLWAYPTIIAPIFNKFSALEDAKTKESIEKLLKNIDFAHNGIFVMDASKRSSHGNAYFTGFGKAKRIVFFDTLLKSLNVEQITAVLAHELGHFKHKHIMKSLVISLIFSFIGFAILGVLYKTPNFYEGHHVSQMSSYMALVLFTWLAPLYTFFLTPVMSFFSRKNEFEADAFAAKYTNAQDLIDALVLLYKENASTLTPDPVYTKFYHSHPPAMERIKHLESFLN